MENFQNVVFCNANKREKKLLASPTFKSFKTFNEDSTTVERFKTSILMNRPIYLGFAIIELPKLLMNNFHYIFIKKQHKTTPY